MLEHACRDVAIGVRRETRITYATYRRVTRKVRCDGARMVEALQRGIGKLIERRGNGSKVSQSQIMTGSAR